MSYGLLNRVDGEELRELVIDVTREYNNRGDSPVASVIQTNIHMIGYFVTNSDLYKALDEMKKTGRISVASHDFEGYHYKLNPEHIE